MEKTSISNREYPVDFKWTLKAVLATVFGFGFVPIVILTMMIIAPLAKPKEGDPSAWAIVTVIVIFFLVVNAVISGLVFLFQILRRNSFSWEIGEDFFVFHQGIITKQQKNLPYGVIQNVIISQDLPDRVLGLKTLIIENAAMGGGIVITNTRGVSYSVPIGFQSNSAVIPGLTGDKAEKLRQIILEKMRLKSFRDDRSGL